MKFGERLEAALTHLVWGPSELATRSGVAMATISALTNRGSDRSNYKEALIKGFPADKISHEWLRDEVGDMIPTARPSTPQGVPLPRTVLEQSNVTEAPALIPSRQIPVVGHVKGGEDGFFEEMRYPVGHGEGTVEYWTRDPHAYALRVKGDSMSPRFRAREFVVVTPSVEAQPGNDVVVRLKDGRKLLKMLNWVHDDEIQLLSINDGHGPTTLALEEIESIQRCAGGVPADSFTPAAPD